MANVKRKCQVVILSTEKASKLSLDVQSNKLYNSVNCESRNPSAIKNQHLYILSDEEIKGGDWCICLTNCYFIDGTKHKVNQLILVDKTNEDYYQVMTEDYKKVIATTDLSIACIKDIVSINQGRFWNHYPTEKWILPQPSKEFINKYIKAYNEGNPIIEIMVEYEEISNGGKGAFDYYQRLKVNKNNYITISKVKDNWSRTEVEELIQNFAQRYNLIQEGESFIEQNL